MSGQEAVGAALGAAGIEVAGGSAADVVGTFDPKLLPNSMGALAAWVRDHLDVLGLPGPGIPTVRAICGLKAEEIDAAAFSKQLSGGNASAQAVAARVRELPPCGANDAGAPGEPGAQSARKGDAGTKARGKKKEKSTPPPANVVPEAMRPIAFSAITLARYNRSFDMEPDAAFTKELQASIRRDGLLAPIILRPIPGKPGRYEVVAGWNRLNALMQLHGADGALQPGEFTIREDLKTDAEAMRASIVENQVRRNVSPYEKARQAARLVGEEGMTQEQVAKLLGETRESVGALIKLATTCDRLDAGWQEDLRAAPGCDTNHKPVITASHWRVICPSVDDDGPGPIIARLMKQARREGWTVRRLKAAFGDDDSGTPAQEAVATAMPVPAPEPEPSAAEHILRGIALLEKAQKAFSAAGGDLAELTGALIAGARDRLGRLVPAEKRAA